MTLGKASAVALAIVGALALGIWISPEVRNATQPAPAGSVVQGSGLPNQGQAATAARAENVSKPAAKPVAVIPATEEKVQDHVKPLLNKGANMEKASSGFRDAETFVTLAHASRNTEIPFVLLKHRVLTEKKSLVSAIRESKPNLDATVEASRARAEAKSDLTKLRG
jgi:hypothetical protein